MAEITPTLEQEVAQIIMVAREAAKIDRTTWASISLSELDKIEAALTRIGGEREKLHRATRFEFSEAGRDVCVEHRGDDRWCVRDGGQVLNRAGEWEHEPFSSARDDGFLARARFSLDEAFARAAALAEKKEELG